MLQLNVPTCPLHLPCFMGFKASLCWHTSIGLRGMVLLHPLSSGLIKLSDMLLHCFAAFSATQMSMGTDAERQVLHSFVQIHGEGMEGRRMTGEIKDADHAS